MLMNFPLYFSRVTSVCSLVSPRPRAESRAAPTRFTVSTSVPSSTAALFLGFHREVGWRERVSEQATEGERETETVEANDRMKERKEGRKKGRKKDGREEEERESRHK